MRHRPLVPLLFSYISGIFLGQIWSYTPAPIHLYLSVPPLLIISLLRPAFNYRFPLHNLLFCVIGFLFTVGQYPESDLSRLAQGRKHVMIEGTVLSPPQLDQLIARFDLSAEKIFINENRINTSGKVLVSVYQYSNTFSPGERIRFPAALRAFENFNNPGHYDYETAQRLKGYACAASVPDGRRIVPMGKGELGIPLEILESLKRPVRSLFQGNLSEHHRAIFQALILGEKHGITPEMREPFNVTGLGHILAVSGLHIGLVAWLVFFMIRVLLSCSYRLTLKWSIRKIAALLTCPPVIAYTAMTGFQVSSQRAMIMVLSYLFSIILGREKEVWSTLALAALLVLVVDPHAIFTMSFQLSFCAVIGILWLAPQIYSLVCHTSQGKERGRSLFKIFLDYALGLIIVTFSATIFLLPITVFYFHRISLVVLPANLTTVPIMGMWVLPLGLLAAFISFVSRSLSALLLQIADVGMDGMIFCMTFWARMSWADIWAITPNLLEIALFYGLLFFLLFMKGRTWAKIGLVVLMFIVALDVMYWISEKAFNKDLRVTYLDVGQGNAALIQLPGSETMLIDGGGFSRGHFDVGQMVVAPFLLQKKIRRIDYLVLTHPQADHLNGLRFIAEHFKPREFWHSGMTVENQPFKELMNTIQSNKVRIITPGDVGEIRDIAGVKFRILHPNPDGDIHVSSQDVSGLNNHSLVLKISYGRQSLLFPGDIEAAGEAKVVSSAGPSLESDILLAPHHGSRSSCTTSFLEHIRPKMCIISSGKGNQFGFPHPQTLERLKAIGCRPIRIDRHGAVEIRVSTQGMQIKTYLD